MGLDTVELIYKIEKTFNISIPDEEAEKIDTVGELQDCVWRHVQGRDRKDVDDIVTQIIIEHSGAEPHEVHPGASITNDLGLD